jgi:hypothetical protein
MSFRRGRIVTAHTLPIEPHLLCTCWFQCRVCGCCLVFPGTRSELFGFTSTNMRRVSHALSRCPLVGSLVVHSDACMRPRCMDGWAKEDVSLGETFVLAVQGYRLLRPSLSCAFYHFPRKTPSLASARLLSSVVTRHGSFYLWEALSGCYDSRLLYAAHYTVR